ncbi:30S ribosomal protein S14 domain protein [Cooperia oncophora]
MYKRLVGGLINHSSPSVVSSQLAIRRTEEAVRRPTATSEEDRRRRAREAEQRPTRRPKTTSKNIVDDGGQGRNGGQLHGVPRTSDPGTDVYRGRSPGPYVPGTSWRTWWKLFSNFLVLRKVTEEREQRLIFLQEVGNSNYELLESLLQGRELEDVELKDLRQAMERHYQPKKLVLAERFGPHVEGPEARTSPARILRGAAESSKYV